MGSHQNLNTMSRKQIIIRPASTIYRRQPLIRDLAPCSGGRIAEVAGGTAAECAAVVCCCPAAVVNMLVLAVYKVPAGVCRKALKEHRRRRLMRKGMLPLRSSASASSISWDETAFSASGLEEEELTVLVVQGGESDQELMELEEEMWQRFDSGGFWRSNSQREI